MEAHRSLELGGAWRLTMNASVGKEYEVRVFVGTQ